MAHLCGYIWLCVKKFGMTYSEIDPQICRWAERHRLTLVTSWAGGEGRAAYVSSKAGECFQIWIDTPADSHVGIHAAGVESRRDDHPPEDWYVSVDAFDEALEEVFQAVMAWMLPSKRHFPDRG
jgi:hypothetical protein